MCEITLVTAFFNIGRESFKAIPRTDDTYLENFKFWCRLKNQLIIYTDKCNANIFFEIRKKIGLASKTRIVVVDDLYNIEPNIFQNMKRIKESEWFEHFRILPDATSNIPEYSYLMLMKTWFLKDAVEKGYAKGTVAWIDFGFNHGGDLYIKPKEFDFLWEYNFSDKIHMFYYKKIDMKPTYEIVRRLCDCIMGCLYIVPDHYCNELWKLTKDAMIILNTMGLYDDDQLLLLMAYRKKPELFEMHKSDWFLPLKEYGGEHLTVKSYPVLSIHKRILSNILRLIHKHKLAFRSALLTYKDLVSKE